MAIIRGDAAPAKDFQDDLGRTNSDPFKKVTFPAVGYEGMKYVDDVSSMKPTPNSISGNVPSEKIEQPY